MEGGQFYGSERLFIVRLSQVKLDPGWRILPAPWCLEPKLWKYSFCLDLGLMDGLTGSSLIWGCAPCCSQHEASSPELRETGLCSLGQGQS